MKLYKTKQGIIINSGNKFYLSDANWDHLINSNSLTSEIKKLIQRSDPITNHETIIADSILPPIGKQEVWASGVTYYRSREARIEESKDAGGGDYYDRVYDAERPELFFKSTHYRVRGHKQKVRIRHDSKWNVPEPELALFINTNKEIVGFTIGNDMSSRDIEGENPLYLPQAKTYDGATALGPCLLISPKLDPETSIQLEIIRRGDVVFSGSTRINQIKRKFNDLVDYLFREMTFAEGVILFTGTGIVPGDDFSLESNDIINIHIDCIGTLTNTVE